MATLPLFNDLREASSNWDFKAILLVDDNRERYQLERVDPLRSIEIEQVGRCWPVPMRRGDSSRCCV
ncbi:MAG: hypothetical protein V1800_06085 [Candidatus Latescibacterota bacterium]